MVSVTIQFIYIDKKFMKTILLIFFISIVFSSIGQDKYIQLSGNIGSKKTYLDCSLEIENKKGFLFMIGGQIGNFGKQRFTGKVFESMTYQDLPTSPYQEWEDTTQFVYVYRQKEFTADNNGFAMNMGIGNRWKLDDNNAVDLKFHVSYYFVEDTHSHTFIDAYTSLPNYTATFKTKHQTISNSLSIVYNRKLNRKLNLIAGAQVFYFVPIKNEKYKPSDINITMMGVENNFLLGVRYKL